MRILGRTISGALAFLLTVSFLHSGEDTEVRAIIAKGIRAHGGEAAKFKGMVMKGAGTFYGLGEGIPFSAEWQIQGQSQERVAMEIKVMDQALNYTQVVNGDKGWVKINTEVNTMPAAQLTEEREEIYARWVSSLEPLKDKAFKLASVGEVQVDGKAALGVRVSHKGKRDVNLFFDKAGGLLVKMETQVKDVKGGGDKDMTQEVLFANFKDFMDIKHPTKITINRDGKLFVEVEMSEIRAVEMIEESVFGQP